MKAVERDMMGWSMTNSSKGVAPLWGGERMLGTTPIAIGFPAGQEPPVIVDMATSAVAFGKVEIAVREGKPIPLGWPADREGDPTTGPKAVTAGGAVVSLGGDREPSGHTGQGLSRG